MNRWKPALPVTILSLTIFLFTMTGVAAQDQSPRNQNQPDQEQVQDQRQPQDQARDQARAESRQRVRFQPDRDLLGEDILGMEVRTSTGEQTGDVEDVIFSREGRIEQFILNTGGGFLGMGGKAVAIHRSDLNYEADQEYAVYRGTEQDLEEMPDINYNWYAYGNRGYRYGDRYPYWGPSYADPEARGYFGEPYGYGPRGMAPGPRGRMPMEPRADRQDQQQRQDNGQMEMGRESQNGMRDDRMYHSPVQPNLPYLSMNNIIGAQVRSRGGDNVGDIDNLVVDPRGRIKSAVIDVGGFLGIGAKTVAVPYKELRDVGPYYVMYPGSEEELENLPEFTEP